MRAHAPPGFFSAGELLLLPNLMSLCRVPLGLAFPFVMAASGGSRLLGLAVIAAAAATDVLDGWLARGRGQATTTGAVLDPLADKVFALSVVGTLLVRGLLPLWAVPALLAREILEAPLLGYVLLAGPRRRPRDVAELRSNLAGKAATVAEFAAVLAAMVAPVVLPELILAAGLLGVAAGVAYWRREIGR
jgi:CDP-diacylglycerol--glycerol-3-phosphate 3-phosphatidyltransferase/cardiolipin synthase